MPDGSKGCDIRQISMSDPGFNSGFKCVCCSMDVDLHHIILWLMRRDYSASWYGRLAQGEGNHLCALLVEH